METEQKFKICEEIYSSIVEKHELIEELMEETKKLLTKNITEVALSKAIELAKNKSDLIMKLLDANAKAFIKLEDLLNEMDREGENGEEWKTNT